VEPPAVFGPCPDCPAGSGKPKGHLGPHEGAWGSKQSAASVEARDFTARASRSKRDFLHNESCEYFEGTTGSIYSRRLKNRDWDPRQPSREAVTRRSLARFQRGCCERQPRRQNGLDKRLRRPRSRQAWAGLDETLALCWFALYESACKLPELEHKETVVKATSAVVEVTGGDPTLIGAVGDGLLAYKSASAASLKARSRGANRAAQVFAWLHRRIEHLVGRRRGRVLDRGRRESNCRPQRQLSDERRRALRCHLDFRARDGDRASRMHLENRRAPRAGPHSGLGVGGWRTRIS